MAGGNGIMNLFSNMFTGGAPAPAGAPAPNTQPTSPGNIPPSTPATGATPNGTAPNGTIPAGTITEDQNKTTTPLDQFDKLWETTPVDPNAPPKQSGVFGDIDPKKFMEAAGKVDFSKVVTPEIFARVQAGGEDGAKALVEAINAASRATYAQSAFASTKLIEQALTRAKQDFVSELPQHIKKQTVSESLRNENPLFSHPAASPILTAIESQLQIKYPSASSAELTNMAKTYLESFAASVAPVNKDTGSGSNKKGAKEVDWDTFFNS